MIKLGPIYEKWNNFSSSKKIFIFLSLFVIFFLPYLSFDYGIWWDEWINTHYAELILKYYLSYGKDTSAATYDWDIHYYGGLFDTWTVGFYHTFKNWGLYETRHFFNALSGSLMIIFTGLIAKEIGNWKTGIIALLFLLFCPHIFGNLMNNPRDIPFASGYIISIYFLIRLLIDFPNPKWKNAFFLSVGVSITTGVRAGGLIFIPYLFLFSAFYLFYVKRIYDKRIVKIFLMIVIISILAYFGSMVAWPLAQLKPFTVPYSALQRFSNYPNLVYVLFEGLYLEGHNLPWYYLPKLIFFTNPVHIFLGLFLFLTLGLAGRIRMYNFNFLIIIIFCCFFPYLYALYKNSLLYDGWRHFYFIFPLLVILSAIGIQNILRIIVNKIFKVVAIIILIILVSEPVLWSFKNHPHEGVYFSPLVGGINKTYTDYQTDCLGNSMRYGAEWLGKYFNANNIDSCSIYTNANIVSSEYYLEKYGKFRLTRELSDEHDYQLLLTRWHTKEQLTTNWPPKGTIYKVMADSVTLCAVVKVKN
ncbi:MAG: hypothetical protein A3H98_10755 [Bacteroidetes bacterium RIFCSPLOWO2_02_FULL_36_8]|nr:MAG: hypothetical protein A3H98_10755 [Bacteroidetes bacterium RIFCSPLOWO2_02_FULL_36_8]OFY71356.1 MAG: hypothetical protein A3G23_04175 [Bacteroidetes bacterium RIFCSPLOWO2_12_FULL_37_12]